MEEKNEDLDIYNEETQEEIQEDNNEENMEDDSEDITQYIEVPENYYDNMVNFQAGQIFCNSLEIGLLIAIALILSINKRK